jgi:hypothetical protein
MKDKFFLVSIYEGDLNSIQMISSIKDARKIMKEAVIDALQGVDESVFESFRLYADYEWQPDSDNAWVNLGKQYSWRIISGEEIINS